MSKWSRWALSLAMCLSACFSVSEPPVLQGGETHFLQRCDGGCGAGFSCSCGVCTRTCSDADSCKNLGANAVCLSADGIGDTRQCEAGGRAQGAVCDERCVDATDCRAGFSCQAGLCRSTPAAMSDMASAQTDAGMSMPAPATNAALPLVMLLSDTSGSMERLVDCTCSTLGCSECVPNCSDGRASRWHDLLATLTGSYAQYGCTLQDRTAREGATYDIDYSIPHVALSTATQQRADGLLDAFSGRVRFASATFDPLLTMTNAPDLIPLAYFGMDFTSDALAGVTSAFSYAGGSGSSPRLRPDGSAVGEIFYPSCTTTYFGDTGVQNAGAAGGALFTTDPADMTLSVTSLKANLRAVRPYGSTPIAAALDDVYYYFTEDPFAPARETTAGRYVILITDGIPDDDFHTYPAPGCGCTTREECGGQDPALMRCPYPTAPESAQHLRCGFDASACQGPIDKLFVISYGRDSSQNSTDSLDAVAAAGGSDTARNANNPVELRKALNAVLEQISPR